MLYSRAFDKAHQYEARSVNKKTIIISKQESDINIFAIILDIFDEIDINDQLEGINELSKYILSRKKKKSKANIRKKDIGDLR